MPNFFLELQRRNVIKAAISYVVISWLILQVTASLLPAFDLPGRRIKYILYVLIGLFPFWIVFAYVFEWTPDGFKKTDSVVPEASEYKKTSRRLNHYIIASLSLAILLLVGDRIFNLTGQPTYGNIDKSIAVLPFENMSNDPEQDYFSIGLTDDIITQLARIQSVHDLSVIYTMLGMYDEAVTILDDILSKPGHFHPKWLEMDPRFKALREHPKYSELINRPLEKEFKIGNL